MSAKPHLFFMLNDTQYANDSEIDNYQNKSVEQILSAEQALEKVIVAS